MTGLRYAPARRLGDAIRVLGEAAGDVLVKDARNQSLVRKAFFKGLHLMEKSEPEMTAIIASMKALGVAKCGATHCTGDRQMAMIRKAFGANYVELGVGNTLVIR